MDIREIINAIHKAIRDFIEGQWEGFKVTRIRSEATSKWCHALRIDEYLEIPGKDIIFDVKAEQEHGRLERQCRLGFGYDGVPRILEERWEARG